MQVTDDAVAHEPGPPPPPPAAAVEAAQASTWEWMREGLRAGVFLRPRMAGRQPAPLQLLLLVAALAVAELGLGRLEINGPANFYLRGWLTPWWGTAAMIFIAWWVLRPAADAPPERASELAGLAAWFALAVVAGFPINLVSQALGIAHAHGVLPPQLRETPWLAWSIYFAIWAWALAVVLRLTWRFGASRLGLAALALGLVAIGGMTQWQFQDRAWYPERAEGEQDRPRMKLSQQTFEAQQALWEKAAANLAPERAGVTDVYGLVFAPYADEDVFLRESSMVAQLLAERFDAVGRVLHLVNHVSTVASHPWATPSNLERAVQTLAARMDTEHDVLVVYLTSHGASDFKLAASHWPLEVEPISPGQLRAALDKAGVKNRVIAVSACYSGGWVGPLAGDTTLLMTAADATHTSYGCGRQSALTFFGRAVFDEQLRKTRSFEQAFAAAVPVIQQREIEADKKDGFSNPQISVGEKLRPVLEALQERLNGPRP